MKKEKAKKLGIVHVSLDMIYNNPEIVQYALRDCIIWRVDCLMYEQKMEYYIEHQDLDDIGLGEITPEYTISLHTKDGEPVEVKFKREV